MNRTVAGIVMAAVASIAMATAATAAAPAELAVAESPVAEGQERFVVVLTRGANRREVATKLRELGGTVEADLGSRLVVTLSPDKVGELRRSEAVKYLERAVLGNPTTDEDMRPLTMSVPSLPALQPNTGQTWTTGVYAYDGAGNISGIGTSESQGTQGYRTYEYDKVGRLTKAALGGVSPASTYEYGYDVYGNRSSYAINGQSTTVPLTSPPNNRLSDAAYDTSGNQTGRGATYAAYDGFNMMTEYGFDGLNAEKFIYTASDERIGALRGTEWTWSLRDPQGKVLRQYRSSSTAPNASWLWVEDFVYRGSLLLGSERVAEEGGRRNYHLDHLGSPRLVTGASGSIISEHDFLPFGEERTAIDQHQLRGFDREEPLRFTGHERDFDNTTPNGSSSYIDYMHARYYGPGAGRFLSPDPVLGNLLRPQSWNRYSYVFNNPSNLIDPFGLAARKPGDKIGEGDTCEGKIVDGWCTGETITVTARDPEAEARERAERAMFELQLFSLQRWKEFTRKALEKPWVLSWIVPLGPEPGVLGVGPAGGVAYNPKTHTACVGVGLGVSAGHNISIGPILHTGKLLRSSSGDIDDILAGWSIAGGGNTPFPTPGSGIGWQVIGNSSGVAQGPTIGMSGLSLSSTYSGCGRLW